MEKHREYFKSLLAENASDRLFEELFALLSWHKTQYGDKSVSGKYDELILLSGKLNNAQQGFQIGTLSSDELNTETSRVNSALLEWLNEMPDAFFETVAQADMAVATGAKKVYAVPAGLSTGLFWMGSVFVLMIALGSLVLENWLTFGFTLAAALISLPPAFQYLANRFRFMLSGSIRIFIVILLTVVGLLFAAPQKKTGGSERMEPQPSTRQ